MKQDLLNYLKQHKLMSLATYGKEHPWICSVYYVLDDDLNFYFISPSDAQHIQDIMQNPTVACSIADSSQEVTSTKVGVQFWGEASEVKGLDVLKTFFKMWKEVINTGEKDFTYDNYAKKIMTSRIYKVTPKKIKWFNEGRENEEEILEL